MVCGGHVCSKNSLCALNILYCMVSLLMIGAVAWGKWLGMVSSIRVVAAVMGVGIFLLLVALSCFRSSPSPSPSCQTCSSIMQEHAGKVLRFVGGVGLFFSFTEIFGVWLAHKYRNTKDPRSNPGAFL
uniref:Tetraspanin 13a n=1 Tax=Takifugu rubripes TaxID=31033 RepID=A0A674N414_TAKRU